MKVEKKKVLKTEVVNFKDLKKVELDTNDTIEEDYNMLNDNLNEYAIELFKKYKFKVDDFKLFYDLSYSQCSGLMFETNSLKYKGLEVKINQSGHYYHENSKDINIISYKNKYTDDLTITQEEKANNLEEEFNEQYISFCKELAKIGYEIIEQTNKDNILKAGFDKWKELNNIESDLEYYDLDTETDTEKAKKLKYVQISDNSNTNFELYIKPFELKQITERVLVSETKINKYKRVV